MGSESFDRVAESIRRDPGSARKDPRRFGGAFRKPELSLNMAECSTRRNQNEAALGSDYIKGGSGSLRQYVIDFQVELVHNILSYNALGCELFRFASACKSANRLTGCRELWKRLSVRPNTCGCSRLCTSHILSCYYFTAGFETPSQASFSCLIFLIIAEERSNKRSIN